MLLVKITGYIVPVAEQPQASLTPVIAIANVADEGAIITGLIRIYRESTGLMIYSSELAVTQLEHHSTTNLAALTPFDPPAPADDDYFVKADITATSYLPGPPTHDSLGAWHFDIKTPPMGEAPAGHHVTHEDGGSDEVDCTGLVGTGPAAHAASHEDGGADELEVADLATAEVDDTLVLAPDGLGGVEFRAEAGGASPGGADSHVQYNNGGAFGGEANLVWDDTNKRLGIGTAAPGQDLSILAQTDFDGEARVTIVTTTKTAMLRVANDLGDSGTLSIAGSTNPYDAFGVNRNAAVFLEASTGASANGLVIGTNGSGAVTLGVNSTAYITILNGGSVGFGTTSPTAQVDLAGDILRIRTAKTPASAGAAGNQGDICWDAGFLYVCVATNSWTRAAIAAW